MLADSLTKPGSPARAVMASFLAKKRWRFTFDPSFESGRARRAPLFTDDVPENHDAIEDPVAFDKLLQDRSYPEEIRKLLRLKYERRSS